MLYNADTLSMSTDLSSSSMTPCAGRSASKTLQSATTGYKALIVEDEAVLAKNMVTYLRRHGVTAHAVGSGREALDWLKDERPAVALVDYDLPGMDGLTLIGHIRETFLSLPIVMVTGRGDNCLEARVRRAGASEYRTKPISLAEVKRVLDALVHAAS